MDYSDGTGVHAEAQMKVGLIWLGSLLAAQVFCTAGVRAQSSASASASAATAPRHVDRSGKPREGEASYYSHQFDGKEMANGQHMDPNSNDAASKTLPLGTKAKVTNLDTGDSAVVVIKDRGPYVGGRIVDVSPKTANKLEMKKDGVVPVQVQPLSLPPHEAGAKADAKSDHAKPGEAHADSSTSK